MTHNCHIGVESVDIAKKRVAIRVSKGGHGIPNEVIERRYIDSLVKLKSVMDICDKINIYDNTEILKMVISINYGKVIWKDRKLPMWLDKTLKSK